MKSKQVIFSTDFTKILLTNKKLLPNNDSLKENQWFPLNEVHSFQNDEGRLVCQELAKSWEFMPNSQPPYKVTKPNNNKVIFFGGSFNPWHAGHEQCLKQLNLPDNIFVIPDNNPQKKSKLSGCVWKRYQDLKAKILSPARIYSGFWTTDQANPTSSWLPLVKSQHPELQLGLLIGFDSFIGLHLWIKADELLKCINDLYIVSRLDNEIAKINQVEYFKEFHPHIDLHFLGHHEHEDLSSTQLRNHS